MKKSLIVTLALVFVLGIAGTAFANPYSDVPAGHWAYKAVVDLQKAGVMEGAGGKFMGNQTLTRYEIAAITARAMAKADKADAATKATIDKLAVEFSKELNDLGVRVAKLEKSKQNIVMTGELRQRAEMIEDVKVAHVSRLRLTLTAPINEEWTFKGRLASEVYSNDQFKTTNALVMDQAYVTGKIGDFATSVGRMPNPHSQMLLSGSSTNWDGIVASVKVMDDATIKLGTLKKSGFRNSADAEFTVADLTVNVAKDLAVNASYMKDSLKGAANVYDSTAYGIKYTGIQDFLVAAEFGKNKAESLVTDAKAQWAIVKYKGASYATPGTYGVWAAYKKGEAGFDPKNYSAGDGARISGAGVDATWNYFNNVKGFELGFDYGLAKNAVFTFNYYQLDQESNGVAYPDQMLAAITWKF